MYLSFARLPLSALVLLPLGCAPGAKDDAADAPVDEAALSAAAKETSREHCDGEDNDADGTIDEDCTTCEWLVTRGRAFWVNNPCVLDGSATGFSLLPVTVGTTSYTTSTAVATYLNAAAASTVQRLGQQVMIAKFNEAAFFIGDLPYHDWDRDGDDESVSELITTANALVTAGSSAQRTSMLSVLTSLNADGSSFGTWFAASCATAPEICNGVDDDGDRTVDEACGCYEVCDGYDNNFDGVTDPDCSTNHAPTLDSVTVGPAVLYTDTDATVSATATDADGDTLTWRYQWSVGGAAVSGATGATLSSTLFARGDAVSVEAWVSDGTVETGPVASAVVVVANSPPVGPGVTVSEVAEASGLPGLRCEVATAATDADGDSVTYTYGWTVDGAGFTNTGSVGATGDYVYNRDLARGSTWTCTVTASDGDASGAGAATQTYSGPAESGYAFETVAYVDYPSDLAVLPSGMLMVSDLLGGMHLVDPDTGEVVTTANPMDAEQELLAFALHPDFGDGLHDWVYLWGSKWGDLYRYDFDADAFTFTNAERVLDLDATNTDGHCGGGLQFWDGETPGDYLLYLGTGPMNDADAQAGDNPGKKILALSVDPITGDVEGAGLDPTATDPTVTAYGTRNPWRITDCGSALCFGDPGVSSYEEVNLYTAAGQNFGHPDQEGPAYGSFDAAALYWGDDEETQTGEDLDGSTRETFANVPFISHRIGGLGYGGRLDGWVLYGDFYDGWVRAAYVNEVGEVEGDSVPVGHQTYLMKFAETDDGTVYAIELGGSVTRLVLRADRDTVGEVGEALSSTVWSSATVYTPRHTLWSNGADKDRKIWLPPGTTIDNSDDAHWVWPDGTRIYKDFALGGVMLETRVLAKEDGVWIPGVYLWDASGTDAYLTEGYSEALSATTSSGDNYLVPSTELCRECHESDRGAEWPLSTTPYRLGDTALATLAPMLDVAPSAAPDVSGTANTRRVRGYLDANCSFCHNPDGVVSKITVIEFDLSYTATMDTTLVAQYYHANPNVDDGRPIFDVASSRDSVLYTVMRNAEMPPIAVWEHDRSIMTPIATWIAAGAP